MNESAQKRVEKFLKKRIRQKNEGLERISRRIRMYETNVFLHSVFRKKLIKMKDCASHLENVIVPGYKMALDALNRGNPRPAARVIGLARASEAFSVFVDFGFFPPPSKGRDIEDAKNAVKKLMRKD